MTELTKGTQRHEQHTDPYEHYEPFDTTAALRSTIARTRADLGETISELASRTDVKARATQMVHDVRSRAKQAVRDRARRAVNRTRDMIRSGRSSAQHGLSSAQHGLQHGLSSAQHGLSSAQHGLQHGVSSAQHGLQRASRSPASIATGAGLVAALGWAVFTMRRRRRLRAERRSAVRAPWAGGMPVRMGRKGARGRAGRWGLR